MDDVLLFKGRFSLTAAPGQSAAPHALPINKNNKKRSIDKCINLYLRLQKIWMILKYHMCNLGHNLRSLDLRTQIASTLAFVGYVTRSS